MQEEIMKGNLKLTVFDSFPYQDLKEVCDAIEQLGYDCTFIDNGNIVFQKRGSARVVEGTRLKEKG